MSQDKKIVIPGEQYTPPSTTQQLIQFVKDPNKQNASNMISTLVMALFTIILTGVSLAQWYEIHDNNADTKRLAEAAVKQAQVAVHQLDALKDSVEQARSQAQATKTLADNSTTQANALKTSADTAAKGLDVTIDSFRKDQRAWVGPIGLSIAALTPRTTEVTMDIKNTGRTPAIGVRYHLQASTALMPIEVDLTQGNRTLFPGDASRNTVTLQAFDEVAINKIMDGTLTLHVYARIEYQDVFGVWHYSKCQVHYDRTLKVLVFDTKGNEAT